MKTVTTFGHYTTNWHHNNTNEAQAKRIFTVELWESLVFEIFETFELTFFLNMVSFAFNRSSSTT